MPLSRDQRLWLQRGAALLLVLVVVPFLVAAGTFADDAPIRVGEASPRTVVADQPVRIVDQEQTEIERERARQAVQPRTARDPAAVEQIIADVREVFTELRAARAPVPVEGTGGETEEPTTREPSEQAQVEQLLEAQPFLGEEPIRALVQLSDAELRQVESEAVDLAQELARQNISADDLDTVLDRELRTELSLRATEFPGDLESVAIEPLMRAVMQPTIVIDEEATQTARDEAASEVAEVVRTWQRNEPIVREGETVTEIQLEALRQRGLEGTDPWLALARAFVAMLLTAIVVAIYLRFMQPRVWASGRRVLLLSALLTGYALMTIGVNLLADSVSAGWWYVLPAGALGMLTAILVAPVVGIATMLPAVLIQLVIAPETTGVAVFVAASVLLSVPLTTHIESRGDLRSATYRVALAFPLLAAVIVLVFGPDDATGVAVAAGLINGIATAMLVQGTLPFLETLFRLPTVTALLDLADRNHPLLRELEKKALGSYNHSVMVASLVERACREVGANALLGNVAALYHDIGKVRQPHFFIENQRGIKNPHDDLDPEISAVIIQNHVVDGVEMAREYKLPPEVVACIGSHHGTMLVTYFYRKALDEAGGDIEKVDIDHYRYKGTKPRSKEAGILVMADCCEAATRSMAMDRGTLPREEIEGICDRLIQERIDDDQFAECDITFHEVTQVRDSIVEALVGIYHPRIAYPDQDEGKGSGDEEPEPDRPVPAHR
ncbi:MAG: HDIG domain-containing protein [Nitriliruptorales bacterium]|nr:HDIG domain-containing protein [Nitriliruptorales bacterium]